MKRALPAESPGHGLRFARGLRRCREASAICLLLAILLSGCEAKPVSQRAAIQSANPDERIMGIRAVAETRDKQAIPLLVDRLEDEDEAVRFYAIIALDKLTGQRFGYDYAVPASQRAKAVEQWREYVRRSS